MVDCETDQIRWHGRLWDYWSWHGRLWGDTERSSLPTNNTSLMISSFMIITLFPHPNKEFLTIWDWWRGWDNLLVLFILIMKYFIYMLITGMGTPNIKPTSDTPGQFAHHWLIIYHLISQSLSHLVGSWKMEETNHLFLFPNSLMNGLLWISIDINTKTIKISNCTLYKP